MRRSNRQAGPLRRERDGHGARTCELFHANSVESIACAAGPLLPARRAPGTIAACARLASTSAGDGSGSRSATVRRLLARPLDGRDRGVAGRAAQRVVDEAHRLAAQRTTGSTAIVVGLPRRLDGTPQRTDRRGAGVRVERCARAPSLPVVLQDERLSSVEAESRLALRDRDWRERKKKLDAARRRSSCRTIWTATDRWQPPARDDDLA